MMHNIKSANKLSTYFLNEHGYNGSAFKAEINIVTKKKKTTVPENSDRIGLIAAATSHKDILHATGVGHLTSDDMFQASQITLNNAKIE